MPQSSPSKPLKPHPGIRIEKIPVKGAAGLIFALGVMFIFWVGLPTVRGFVILGAVGGLAAFAVLRWWRNRDQGPTAQQRLFPGTTTPASRADQAGRSAQSPTPD
jgi:hypothetical protein